MLNEVDWKSNVYGFAIYSYPWINGRECAGRVVEIGSEVDNERLKLGDRVFVASSNYRDIRTSSFQERCVALPENCGRIPDFMSYEEAAGLGVALIAGAAALYDCLGVPRSGSIASTAGKPHEGGWLLIWASASSAGIIATQLAKHAGLRVIGVCSKNNFEYTKSRGVDIALDREDPERVVQVARARGIKFAIDCVGSETAAHAARALQDRGILVPLVKAPQEMPRGVISKEILIKKFHEDPVYAEGLIRFSESLLLDRALSGPRIRIVGAGLAGIPAGLGLLQKNQISGEKVVVRMRDTPTEQPKRARSRAETPLSRPLTPNGSLETSANKRQRVAA